MDLEDRFRALARTNAPDLWEQIEGRRPSDGSLGGPSPARRIVVALVAAIVAAAGIGFAIEAFQTDGRAGHSPIGSGDRIAIRESRQGKGEGSPPILRSSSSIPVPADRPRSRTRPSAGGSSQQSRGRRTADDLLT
jgi:hypothetical protein